MEKRIVAAVAAGGVLGSLARYGVTEALPHLWGTFAVNVSGCLLIGALLEAMPGRYTRAFIGTGVLGGYTTFSAYAVEATSVVYTAGTLAAALAAVVAGGWITRRLR